MVLLSRKAVVQAAIEDTYGTEKALTLNDGILVEDPDYSVDVETLERNFTRNDLSPLASVTGRKLASMTFTTELRGNGLQNSGNVADAPVLARLLRACGYSLTGVAAAEASAVKQIGDVAVKPTWAAGGTLTNTDLITYYLEVTTGGASGTAEITVSSDTSGEGNAAALVTSGSPLTVGSQGLTLTPTFSGNLRAGDRWVVWLFPTGMRLDPVSDGFESLTMKMNMDGVSHKMLGCYGTFEVNAEAGQYAKIEWTFTGTYIDPVDEAMPDVNYETTLPPMVELARLRIDEFSAIVNAVSFDQANDVQIRPDVNSKDGYIGTRIVSRAPEGGIDPEADLVANHDFWGRLAGGTRMPFQMRVGTQAGNTVWLLSPSTQYTGLTYGDRNGIRTYDAGLKFSGVDGDDEVSFFFA